VALKNLPKGRNSINHGGIRVNDGVYAVVESSELDLTPGEIEMSDLLIPYMKTVEIGDDGLVGRRTFYLADTEAFVGPCCSVPDIGGPTNRYFVVKSRDLWAEEFLRWVDDNHNLDEMDAFEEDASTQSGLSSMDEDENSSLDESEANYYSSNTEYSSD
jgi:hypothetical protein